ncbi:unnamed protein product [Prunus armeniaca]
MDGKLDDVKVREEALQKTVSMQPVTAAVAGRGMTFRHYSSGNSWGANWGEGGYMRLRKDVGFPEDLCGIAMYASYPVG